MHTVVYFIFTSLNVTRSRGQPLTVRTTAWKLDKGLTPPDPEISPCHKMLHRDSELDIGTSSGLLWTR